MLPTACCNPAATGGMRDFDQSHSKPHLTQNGRLENDKWRNRCNIAKMINHKKSIRAQLFDMTKVIREKAGTQRNEEGERER